MNKQVKVIFKGRVQGVGFRYTTQDVASRFRITGYVKNLPDGTVEVIACGEESVLHEFVKAVHQSPLNPHIGDTLTTWGPAPSTPYQGFQIRY